MPLSPLAPATRHESGGGDDSSSARPLVTVRGERAWLVGLVLAGLVLRMGYLLEIAGQPFFGATQGAGARLLERAALIAAGHGRGATPAFDGFAFDPWIARLVLAIPGAGAVAVCALQLVAGMLGVLLLARAARGLFGAMAGIATAALGAFYGPFAFLDANLPGSGWVVLGFALALDGVLAWDRSRARARASWFSPFIAGLGLGIAASEQPHLIVLAPLALAWCAARAGWRGLLPACAGLIAPIALLAALAGPAALGAATAAVSAGPAHPAARPQPLAAASLTAGRALRLVNAAETPGAVTYGFERESAWTLAAMPVGFAAVLPLAVIGFVGWWEDRRRRASLFLLVTLAIAAACAVLPFFVNDAQRATLLPPLLILAGGGVAALIQFGAGSRHAPAPRVRPALIAGAIAFALTLVPLAQPARAHEWMTLARAWDARGNLSAAAHAYEHAVDASSGAQGAAILERLAQVYDAMSEHDRALSAARDAVRLDPERASARRELGVRLLAHGEPERALRELSEAVRLGGQDPRTLMTIAAAFHQIGDHADAMTIEARAAALAVGEANSAARPTPSVAPADTSSPVPQPSRAAGARSSRRLP